MAMNQAKDHSSVKEVSALVHSKKETVFPREYFGGLIELLEECSEVVAGTQQAGAAVRDAEHLTTHEQAIAPAMAFVNVRCS
jgi:hypothetical protein